MAAIVPVKYRPGWTCAIDGCGSVKPAPRGLCWAHYTRLIRHGDADHGPGGNSWFEMRLARNVTITGFCWYWNRPGVGGYGRAVRDGASIPAHRWVYEELVGPVPDGLVMDHLCRNPSCVNPDHLEPVTQLENVRRSLHCTRRWCPRGHDLWDPENLYPGKRRRCKPCTREKNMEAYRRAKSRLSASPHS